MMTITRRRVSKLRPSNRQANPDLSLAGRLCRLVTVTLVVVSAPVSAATINVPADFPTIQQALTAASSGDTVLVAAGTYFEHTLLFDGKDIALVSVSGPASTIINASDLGPVFHLDGPLTRAALIEGFTIRDGHKDDGNGGAGIWITEGSPTIRGNWILSNVSTQTGGGIKAIELPMLPAVNPLIEDNLISDNEGHAGGGGIHISSATAEIRGNTITDNLSDQTDLRTGAGIKLTFTTANVDISDNDIRRNRASGGGGGIAAFVSDFTVTNNDIIDNYAGELGGGILFETNDGDPDKTGTVTGNTISENTACDDVVGGVSPTGGAVHTFLESTSSTFVMTDNLMENNTCLSGICSDPIADTCGKGGAIGAFRGLATQEFRNNILRGNRADQYGGALLIGAGVGTIDFEFEENLVENNTARVGYPGIGCVGTGGCLVARNRFIANVNDVAGREATRNPGALYMKDSGTSVVENNFFRANEGHHSGAVLVIDHNLAEPDTEIRNNTFVDNVTHWASGGTLGIEEPAQINNNIFFGDSRGIRTWNSPAIEVHENDFFAFTVGVITGGPTHGSAASLNTETFASGNEELDPLFQFANDVHLDSGSPLIDAGDCTVAPTDDIDNDARPFGPECDIGADEFSPIFADGFESGDTASWTSAVP